MDQGLLPVLSAQEVAQAEIDRQTIRQEAAKSTEEIETSLIKNIMEKWTAAKEAKVEVELQMLKNVRQRKGEYDPEKLSEIRSVEQPEIFLNVTDTKCYNGIAWIKDIVIQPSMRIFAVDPTPVPELPPQIKAQITQGVVRQFLDMAVSQAQQTGQAIPSEMLRTYIQQQSEEIDIKVHAAIIKKAKQMAEDVADQIDDHFTEGGFYKALEQAIDDIVAVKNGFIKGPIFRKERVKRTIQDPRTGKISKTVEERIVPQYDRRSPFSIFPSPRSTGIDNGYLFDVITITPRQLHGLIGVEGFKEDEIRAVLKEFDDGELKGDWLDLSSESLEGLGQDIDDENAKAETIYGLELWDEASGEDLLEWGMTEEDIPDPANHYPVCVWVINKHIIKAMLYYDKLGRKPYSMTGFRTNNDSFWATPIPELIADCQQICNACARNILANIGMGALPMVDLNVDRLEPNASRKIWPGRIFPTTDEQMGAGSKAVNFYQPTMVTDQLTNVYHTFSKIADEHSGVPAWTHGDTAVGGAGNALANYEKILTPYGPTEIGKIHSGDTVCTTYGECALVTGVYPQGESEIFRVKFSNGTHVDCDMNHRWSVRRHQNRRFRTLTTAEILQKGLFRKTILGFRSPKGYRPLWMVPIVDCVEFYPRDIKVDPYTMGVLLGDGDTRCRVTSMDQEIFDRIPYPLGTISRKYHGQAWCRAVMGIKSDYLGYGLKCKSTEKFIPEDYLFNTTEVRLELLRGLMDTDGCCSKQGEVFFATSSPKLSDDFIKLVRSLGGIVSGVSKQKEGYRDFGKGECFCKEGYRIVFNLSGEQLFYVKRKQERMHETQKTHTYITGIEYVGNDFATCISVDSKDKLFLCENCIPTHNTSSGLSQLITQAARGIRSVVRNIDLDLIVPTLERHYDYLLDNFEIYGLMGDYKLSAKGTSALIAKEQQSMRKTEFMNYTQNPVDIQLIGPENRRKMLFDVAKDLGIDLDDGPAPAIPVQQLIQPPAPPQQGQETLGNDGNPVVGQDTRQFNPSNPVGQVSTVGNPGTAIPGRAGGGPVSAGQPYVVGERGPEVVIPDQNGTVIPNEEAQFQSWIRSTPWFSEFTQNYGQEPNLNDPNYDYRAAWKGGAAPNVRNTYDNQYHWPSSLPDGTMLKGPKHPTAWMENFMRKTGVDPQSLGLKTAEDGSKYLEGLR